MIGTKRRQIDLNADEPDRDSSSQLALTSEQLRKVGAGRFFRPRDLAELGLTFRDLGRLIKGGAALQVARGLYRLTDAEPTEHYTLAAVCARVPSAIVCLLSALRVHELGTQLPCEVWIAIPHKARAPRIPEFPTQIIRFSGPSLRYGVERISVEGIPIRITNAARTVVDCFRFHRRVGRDVAREALREALRERKATAEEIWRAAEVCRARSLVEPVLEALVG
jgi:predicted transcriptional regulator of viral defense system